MVLSVFGVMAITANAADLSWIDETGAAHTLTYGTEGDLPTATVDGETILFDKAWESTNSFPTESGNYCLMNDITMSVNGDDWNPGDDKNIEYFVSPHFYIAENGKNELAYFTPAY